MAPAEAFGQVLKRRRLASSLSQEALALDAGLERVFISMLENGRRQPTFQTMLKLSSVLGCSAAEMVDEAETLLAQAQSNN